MAASHAKLNLTVDIKPLKKSLQVHSDLFGQFNWRKREGSPHVEMDDIWLRYNDKEPYLKANDFTGFNDEHDSVWYDSLHQLPEVLTPVFDVMNKVQGERLGMVLITRLPPGGKIHPHVDQGWHAEYYDKYYIPIQNGKGSSFYFDDGLIGSPDEGSVWWFDNSNPHWVNNNSEIERIAMIVCVKTTNKLGAQ